MNTPDAMGASDEPDLRAAEYVLGTLSAAEREAYRRDRATSPALQAAERAWEARLAPLTGAVPEVAAPPGAWQGIAARLAAEGPRPAAPVVDLRPALRRWRRAALAAGALAAGLAVFIAVERLAPRPETAQYLAVVNRGGELPALVVRVDTAGRHGPGPAARRRGSPRPQPRTLGGAGGGRAPLARPRPARGRHPVPPAGRRPGAHRGGEPCRHRGAAGWLALGRPDRAGGL